MSSELYARIYTLEDCECIAVLITMKGLYSGKDVTKSLNALKFTGFAGSDGTTPYTQSDTLTQTHIQVCLTILVRTFVSHSKWCYS